MIAAGTGTPLHFLDEGDTATLATAREMGEPTRRRYEARHLVVRNIITDILQTAISRRFPDRSRAYTLDITMPVSPRAPMRVCVASSIWLRTSPAHGTIWSATDSTHCRNSPPSRHPFAGHTNLRQDRDLSGFTGGARPNRRQDRHSR